MKKTIILASVAVATLFAFSSCQKENLENNCSTSGVRIITGTFENGGTKTTLQDGKTPKWAVGDVIRILSSGAYKDVTLEAGSGTPAEGKGIIDNVNGSITIAIPTAMTGTLYAVYPASATAMTSCSDGNINFTIPSVQDGTFASANICVAEGDDKDNLIFHNATAVLEITTAADVVGVDITAANKIAGPVTALFSGTTLNLTTSSLDKTSVSAVGTSAPSGNVFYLAAAPGTTGSTTATCYKIDQKGSAAKEAKDLQRNVIYLMDLSSEITFNTDCDLTGTKGVLNGHEYVIIKAKYDGTNYSYLKWATMNIGASSKTEFGQYFAWGETTGHALTAAVAGRTFDGSEIPNAFENIYNFSWATAPFNNGASSCDKSYFTSNKNNWIGADDNLKSEYDAATKNWGTGWRMPKGYVGAGAGEFKALKEATYWQWDETNKGYYVYAPQSEEDAGGLNGKQSDGTDVIGTYNDKSTALLFFPAAGGGSGTALRNAGSGGCYWSSSFNSSNPFTAYSLSFNSDDVYPQPYDIRYPGFSVRPVSD